MTPRTAAPSDLTVEPRVATNLLDMEVHTKPVPHARRDRRRRQARIQALHPPRIVLAAIAGYERAVATLRMPTQPRHRQAPPASRPRRNAQLAMRHGDLLEPDRELPAAVQADPTRRSRST